VSNERRAPLRQTHEESIVLSCNSLSPACLLSSKKERASEPGRAKGERKKKGWASRDGVDELQSIGTDDDDAAS